LAGLVYRLPCRACVPIWQRTIRRRRGRMHVAAALLLLAERTVGWLYNRFNYYSAINIEETPGGKAEVVISPLTRHVPRRSGV
ncbi:unnamed protein product, partial [Ectocarpus sp. 4 AP-2014]